MQANQTFWITAILFVALYCTVRTVIDFRQRRYFWATASMAATAIVLLVPFPTHAIKVELPMAR